VKIAALASFLIRKLWLTLAILLVVAAVSMTLLRFSLPYLPDLTDEVENWLAAQYQLDVEVAELSADWARTGPRLVLRDLTINDDDAEGTASEGLQVSVGRTFVALDLWRSLINFTPVVSTFLIADADIHYQRTTDTQTGDVATTLEDLFLRQLQRFSMQDSTLRVSLDGEATRTLLIDDLSWQNQGSRHRGSGQFRVSEFTANRLDFIIDVEGDGFRELTGRSYVAANDFDISPWLQQRFTRGEITNAALNFRGWLNLVDGQMVDGTLQLENNVLEWRHADKRYGLELTQGLLKLQQQQNGWLINSSPMQMLSVHESRQAWELPPLQWAFQAQHQASIQNLPLQPLVPLLSLLGGEALYDQIGTAEVSGLLDLGVQFSDTDDFTWALVGRDLAAVGDAQIPGFKQLNLRGEGSLSHGNLRFSADNLEIQSAVLAGTAGWRVDRLDLDVHFNHTEQGVRVWLGDNGAIDLADMRLLPTGGLLLPTQDSDQNAEVSLQLASSGPFSVDTLRRYLPLALGENLQEYLATSVNAGTVEQLLLLWRGAPEHFPYADGNPERHSAGMFEAHAWFEDMTFKFQPDWPAITNMQARLSVFGDDLSITADAGQIADMAIAQTTAVIADMQAGQVVLNIDAAMQGDAPDALPLFQASPLADSVGSALSELRLQDQINGRMQLSIPLYEDALEAVAVSGSVSFNENALQILAVDTEFTELSGTFRFANDVIAADDLQLKWQGLPLEVDVSGRSLEDGSYQVRADVRADWQTDLIYSVQPEAPLKDLIYGAVNGNGSFEINLAGDDYRYQWQHRADFTGLETSLPPPFTKEFGESWYWNFSLEGDANGMDAETALLLPRAEASGTAAEPIVLVDGKAKLAAGARELESGYIHVGEGFTPDVLPNSSQFIVNASLAQSDIGLWFSFFNQVGGSGSDDDGLHPSFTPDLIEVRSDAVTWAGQRFNDARIRALPNRSGWQIDLDAEQTAMRIDVPTDVDTQGVQVNARFLELVDFDTIRTTAAETPEIDLTGLPKLSFQCDRCQYGRYNLGEIKAQLSPLENGLSIDSIEVLRGSHQLQLSGEWIKPTLVADEETSPSRTFINGSLSSSDFGGLLSEYDITTVIQDSSASINFDLNWQGSPYEVNLESLNGRTEWTLGRGYLRDVNEGGARLLSILSLEGLLRKLTLDFRDVFSNGMFYTRFGGTLSVVDGLVETQDTNLYGSAGDLEVRGTTNLVDEEVDYRLVYIPKVTSSLPVILAWMVNPPSGLAALLIDRMLFDAQVISRLEYRVTGSIDDPVIEEVSRDSREVEVADPEAEPAQEDSQNDRP